MLDQQTLQVVFHSLLYLHWLNTWGEMGALPEAPPSPSSLTPVHRDSMAVSQ